MTPLRLWELAGQPDLATIQAMHPERYPGLFRTTGTDSGWDILFGFPQQIDRFSISDGLAALVRHPAMQLRTPARNEAATQLPFTGGWLAFMAYELGGLLEPSVGYAPALTDFPLAWLARIPVAILRQPSSGRCVLKRLMQA
jgi:anthranilate synthase component 1